MTTIFLLLGSNLGDRETIMQTAIARIGERVGEVMRASALYETAPWGGIEQPAFLNQVLEIGTSLAPEEVLRLILELEHEAGRIRYERWGARHLDVDILYFGQKIMDTPRLTVPHPRLHERRFTLIPLAEIAPDFVHPVLNITNRKLLEICQDEEPVALFRSV
ncbi:2-amino-4-hydroxy-6-hydroxymethyldihydropteridine diphosphokinase [Persicitalea jodogahamensis]|uniref:2-amino-4-hydroxy-6-hydroxymethyldihydropteridine pyrophosphokinase n=1 Tax=Persicitalea jodogahamensis TaxID=402147 RepID=A0A8J3GAX6_9BACT|nr:2-amino-4-hydroxy-6-hydroxymethyldihydropteridine diphosphokinase [Persicitalea jodogahamensis]GHB83400.1 2-amino-4-hydroxy-6-hydroxymethyldihydropteridine diphosphokinase [Persicitalea jodogahamensis]